MQLPLISHEVENTLILQRSSDGYVNATAMCKASGKSFYDYFRINPTREFLTELASETGIPVSDLVISIKGGIPDMQGTWVHPDVAINLGQWCSPKFAVAVSKWIREWMTGKLKAPGLPPHLERYMANVSSVPAGYFSMLNEMTLSLVAPLEMLGYTIPEKMMPDISAGKMFCKFLRDELGVDTDSLPTYYHHFKDGRVVKAKLYPNSVLAAFRTYFNNVWLPRRALPYFETRDPIAAKFLPELTKSSTHELH